MPTPNNEAAALRQRGRGPHLRRRALGARCAPVEGASGYLAYTLSRSERRENSTAAGGSSIRIRRTSLPSAASQGLGEGWEVGARFRLVSGNPTTPIVGSIYDARSGVYVPEYGAVNSDAEPHLPPARPARREEVAKVGDGSAGRVSRVQNAYNARELRGLSLQLRLPRTRDRHGASLVPEPRSAR